MTANLLFWLFAFLDLGVVAGAAVAGARAAQQGDLLRHQRWMNTAAALVVLFLLLYAGKLAWLGPEPIAEWSANRRVILYIHETFAGSMLVCGSGARLLARSLQRDLASGGNLNATTRRRHRLLGKLAVGSAVLALATSTLVLGGMLAAVGSAG